MSTEHTSPRLARNLTPEQARVIIDPRTGSRYPYMLYVPEREGTMLASRLQDVVGEIVGGFGVDDAYTRLNLQDPADRNRALHVRVAAMQACVDVHLAETTHAFVWSSPEGLPETELVLATTGETSSREADLREHGFWDGRPWTLPVSLPLVGWSDTSEAGYLPAVPAHLTSSVYVIDVTTEQGFMAGIVRMRLMDYLDNSDE